MALGTFLVHRRGRLRPRDFGLSEERRRTPGLRREEVASLAEVSVSWYTWLEQGRDIRVSPEALRRISTALRLDRAETEHLFALASQRSPTRPADEVVSERLLLLVDALDPLAAYVRNSRLDILAWNRSAAELFVDYGKLAPHERNTLRLLFLDAEYRSLVVDWETFARETLATFRAARAKSDDKSPFDELVRELCTRSPEFAEWWPRLDVKSFDEGRKSVRHPQRGLLSLSYVALAPQDHPELSLVTYVVVPRAAASDEPRTGVEGSSHRALGQDPSRSEGP